MLYSAESLAFIRGIGARIERELGRLASARAKRDGRGLVTADDVAVALASIRLADMLVDPDDSPTPAAIRRAGTP